MDCFSSSILFKTTTSTTVLWQTNMPQEIINLALKKKNRIYALCGFNFLISTYVCYIIVELFHIEFFFYFRSKRTDFGPHDWHSMPVSGAQTWLVVPGLEPGTEYQFSVLAQNKLGTGPFSEVVTVNTAGETSQPIRLWVYSVICILQKYCPPVCLRLILMLILVIKNIKILYVLDFNIRSYSYSWQL